MRVQSNAIELIGNTPMVRARHLDTGPCELFLKLESQNPTGSIKDRIGLSMIEVAEADGSLEPGGTVVEGTAGNTGLALALVARQKGYRCVVVMPDKMSREKVYHLRAMGAEVILTRSDVPGGHPEHYQAIAAKFAADTPGAYHINQFANPANPLAHEQGTGPEILAQMDGRLDALVCGVGSAGTMTGLSRFFARESPGTEMILADPAGSLIAEYTRTGRIEGKGGSYVVEGIGGSEVPPVADLSHVAHVYTIRDRESLLAARALLYQEGILGGSSTGTCLAAALHYCQAQTEPKRVVSFVCDTGNKYLSKQFNDQWMSDQGFLEREQHGDLRDLIAHPHPKHEAVVVGPDEPLANAYGRMKLYDVSQLPVVEVDRVVGIVDESDMLMAVYGNEGRFAQPVRDAMITGLRTLQADASIDDLLTVFANDHVAIINRGEQFEGLITRMDLLHHLRRRVE